MDAALPGDDAGILAQLTDEVARMAGTMRGLQREVEQLKADQAHPSIPSLPPPDTHEQSTEPVSRRGALRAIGGAVAGGAGLAIGTSLLTAAPASATDGNVTLGAMNTETATTNVTNTTAASNALTGVAAADAAGVHGVLGEVIGLVSNAGVLGEDSTGNSGVTGVCAGLAGVGVHGIGNSLNGTIVGTGDPTGVFGESGDTNGIGVAGVAPNGTGILGYSGSPSSVGVWAENSAGAQMLLFPSLATLPERLCLK